MTNPDQPQDGRTPERPDHDRAGQAPDAQGRYPGRPLEDSGGRPQYGVRLPPEQQAQQQRQWGQQPPAYSQPQPPYGQPQSPYGQPPYGQQPYGYPPQGMDQSMGPIQRPRSIDRSYWLILAAGLVFVISQVTLLFSPDMGLPPEMRTELQSQLEATGVTVDLESFLQTVRTVTVVFAIILAVLYWLIATGIRKGSNVARIFGTIFAAMSLVGMLMALPAGVSVDVIYSALGVIGIVFAYLQPSNEYFRAKAWEKALRR